MPISSTARLDTFDTGVAIHLPVEGVDLVHTELFGKRQVVAVWK